MKISFFSNAPFVATGYGNQTKLFAPRLRDIAGYDIAISAFYGLHGAVIEWNGIQIYPGGYHSYGQDVVTAHAAHQEADIVITLMDAWVCEPEQYAHGKVWCPWFPIDSEPLPRRIYDKVIQSFQPIVFSRFGERVSQEAGLDVRYVPHAIDTSELRPMDRDEAREMLEFPKDRFIVGMVAANKGNPSRKALTEQMLAFRMFKDQHPDALLYLHTTTGQRGELGGENLVNYANSLGLAIGEDVIFADQYTLLLGFGDEYMRCVYNAIDVLLSVSKGEGFGIPIIEAQACGCPVIVGDWTAMGELCLSGWKVPKEHATPWWTPLETYQYIPRPSAIATCLEQAYKHWGDTTLRKRARKRALAYDADRVTREFWVPVLAEIEQRLKGTTAPEPVAVGDAS